jgi:signal transduction histidine kinase
MTDWLKQLGGLVTRLRDKIVSNIFTSARLRITLLYFLVGILMFSIAGVFIYNRTLYILQIFTQGITGAIIENATSTIGFPPILTATSTSQIVQSAAITQTIEEEIKTMILLTSFWMTLGMLISAYILAGITLRPIQRVMENKKRFIANVSHELRTPLSVMRTEAEATLIDEESATKDELVSVLKGSITEIDHMAKIIELLLTFSNFEHRNNTLILSPVCLSEVVEKTVQTIEPTAHTKQITIQVENQPNVYVHGSAIALQEMLLNLIKNAIHYTAPDGEIRVRLIKKPYGSVILSVEDTGTGIPEHDLPHIFEPFYRGRHRTQGKAHAGIGLAIVKEIVTLHRGTVIVKSRINEGTSVEIRLPRGTS